MEMFKMIKEAAAMRSKLSQMDKALRDKVLDVELHNIKIKVNAKSEIMELKLPQDILQKDLAKVEKEILSAVQYAVKKSQEAMAEEAKKLTGGMNIPGLM